MNVLCGEFRGGKTPAIGLVLGAGGVVGQAYQAGVLSALQRETGWDPRQAAIIVGTSAGSVTGAALRVGVPATDLAASLYGVPTSREGGAILRRILPPTPSHSRPRRSAHCSARGTFPPPHSSRGRSGGPWPSGPMWLP
jgi:predicted acylesterase/phospholipase RssA